MHDMERKFILVQGQVQGVGFRPFIWRLAKKYALSGFCGNASDGVRIEIQGTKASMEKFLQSLKNNPPALAIITSVSVKNLSLETAEKEFHIIASSSNAGKEILVAPDMGICPECLADIRDSKNHRFGYAFTNCVNCGPRYSITRELPYDRPNTVMSCFPMCPVCLKEYENPADRRFHAQPIACPDCGPKLWLVEKKYPQEHAATEYCDADALKQAAKLLLNGNILALKGLGGFQLACDARNEKSVARLRKLKRRPCKAFAVMTDTVEATEKFVKLSQLQKKLLNSSEKPVVLCASTSDSKFRLAANIAPDSLFTGVMLPCTPLHYLLFDNLRLLGMKDPALVMTSGNPAGEPICLGNRQALESLSTLADAWLLHNRDILVRVDDSVVGTSSDPWKQTDDSKHSPIREQAISIRRARGYVPAKIDLPLSVDQCILGTGAELKNTFCLTRRKQAFPSQHIGDLSTPAILDFYQSVLEHMQNLLGVTPQAVVHDLHGDFLSTQLGKSIAQKNSLPCIGLQHHAAHASALLAENGIMDDAIVIALDGTGLGIDGSIWGGEFLLMRPSKAEWERIGSFGTFVLPGGDMATLFPWRIARSIDRNFLPPESMATKKQIEMLDEMLAKKINCHSTSSCGRLFDGISSLLGFCHESTYEGQAAARLETEARKWLNKNPSCKPPEMKIPIIRESLPRLDISAFASEIKKLADSTGDNGLAAAAFHWNLGNSIANFAIDLAQEYKVDQIGMTGGVMVNSLLASKIQKPVIRQGLKAFTHKQMPPGDGSISLGQAFWGQLLTAHGKL